MNFTHKVAVAVSLDEPMPQILSCLRTMDFLSTNEIHFINVQMTTRYAIGLGESAIIYPLEEDQKKISELTLKKLSEISTELLPRGFKGKIVTECLFSEDPKRKFCEYVAEKHIDTVIIASREKRGIFESSFAQFVTKHTKANIIILKHKV